MKVSISTQQSCTTTASDTTIKLCDETINLFESLDTTPLVSNTSINSCYEPTSVLDIQRSPSPNPVTFPPPSDQSSIVDLENSSEGWDSILSELGFNNDDDSHLTQLPDDFPTSQSFDQNFPTINLTSDPCFSDIHNFDVNLGSLDLPYQNVNTYGSSDMIDDLFQATQCFESNESHQLQMILSQLNQRLRSPVGKPLQRAAFYFKEALQRLVWGHTQPTQLSSLEVVNTIQAFKIFSWMSPVTLFSAFAANQAILEAMDGSMFIHIIDFDIDFGGHWASFMRELVDKSNPRKLKSMVLRITAIIPNVFEIEQNLVRENLMQFAGDLNINFYIDFVTFKNFEVSSFESVMFMEGERIAVHLCPNVLHEIGNNSSTGGISKFVADLRGISPRVVVVVDKEVGINVETASFSMSFAAGMEFYTGIMETLDVALANGGVMNNGGDCVRRIEMFVLQPRIMAVVQAAATVSRRRMTWRDAFVEAGIKAIGFTQFANFQAECLLKNTQIAGFHMGKRHGEMVLCWHDKALVATSVWRC